MVAGAPGRILFNVEDEHADYPGLLTGRRSGQLESYLTNGINVILSGARLRFAEDECRLAEFFFD